MLLKNVWSKSGKDEFRRFTIDFSFSYLETKGCSRMLCSSEEAINTFSS